MPIDLTIRELQAADPPVIAAAFTAQGWNKPLAQYLAYYQQGLSGERTTLLACWDGEFAGYLTIVWLPDDYPPFAEAGIPAIVDFNVLIKFRRRGIGSVLMDEAEARIAGRSPVAGIGVGLTPDYGPAQILYARRGYVPDGRGIWTAGHHVAYGERVLVDDDLVLFLTRRVR